MTRSRNIRSKTPLTVTHPELAAEAYGWDPAKVVAGSNRKRTWKCTTGGHTWDAAPNTRTGLGTGCPYCSGRRAVPGLNDLATLRPEIAAMADGWNALGVSVSSHLKKAWKCSRGHTFIATVDSRSRGAGCVYCAGQKPWPGETDLATTHPQLASQADGWDPTTVSAGSERRMAWKCARGHRWVAVVNSRRARGCPQCGGYTVIPGETDLATLHPHIAATAHRWDPSILGPGSEKVKQWDCPSGHIYSMSPSDRVSGSNCPYCAGKRVLVGFNDLASQNSAIASQASGWDPATVTAGSNKRMPWECNQGHTWSAPVVRRTQGVGCPTCAGKIVIPGVTDLATTNPELASQAHNWDPASVSAGSDARRAWVCSEGHVWIAAVSSRSTRERGCPGCAKYGFHHDRPGHLYIQSLAAREAPDRVLGWKIGITNDVERRTKQQRSASGLSVVTVAVFDGLGSDAYAVEQAVLRWWRQDLQVPACLPRAAMVDGWSETIDVESMTLERLLRFIDREAQDLLGRRQEI